MSLSITKDISSTVAQPQEGLSRISSCLGTEGGAYDSLALPPIFLQSELFIEKMVNDTHSRQW